MKRPMNPILARELKERMRSIRVPIVLTVYLLLLGLIVFTTERSATSEIQFGNPFASVTIGRTVFHYLLFFLLMFVCFMVPAFTAGSISGERERQTFHLVQVSMMRPSAIVLGKLGAAMSYLGLLIIATIPLVSVSFILGGVTPLDVLRGYAMVLLAGFTIAMMSIGFSANLRRTLASTVIAFGAVFALTIGTVIGFGLVSFMQARDRFEQQDFRPQPRPVWTLVLNPFVGTASAIQGKDTGGRGATPFEGLFSFLTRSPETIVVEDGRFEPPIPAPPVAIPVPAEDHPIEVRKIERRARIVAQAQPPDQPWRAPVWLSTIIGYVVLSSLSYAAAISGVRAPRSALALPGGGRKVKRRRSLQEA